MTSASGGSGLVQRRELHVQVAGNKGATGGVRVRGARRARSGGCEGGPSAPVSSRARCRPDPGRPRRVAAPDRSHRRADEHDAVGASSCELDRGGDVVALEVAEGAEPTGSAVTPRVVGDHVEAPLVQRLREATSSGCSDDAVKPWATTTAPIGSPSTSQRRPASSTASQVVRRGRGTRRLPRGRGGRDHRRPASGQEAVPAHRPVEPPGRQGDAGAGQPERHEGLREHEGRDGLAQEQPQRQGRVHQEHRRPEQRDAEEEPPDVRMVGERLREGTEVVGEPLGEGAAQRRTTRKAPPTIVVPSVGCRK